MCLRSAMKRIKWPEPKQELPTMRVLRFGGMNLMITSAISGPMDACFMRCVLLNHLLGALILMNFFSLFKKATTVNYLRFIPQNWRYL